MDTLNQHEEALVKAFVIQDKQPVYLTLLGDPHTRRKVISQLPHWADLDDRFARRIPPAHRKAAQIESLLRQKGAPQVCYLISEDVELDGREMPLREALNAIVASGAGTVISCKPGELAYYESEDPDERYVLERNGTAGSNGAMH